MIIKNGLVIDPASGLSEKMDLLIEDGIIKEMASLITKEGEEVLDAAGLVVAPGLIDTHVHFRDPGFTYQETIHTGALASAKGGFTSVICMANTSPTGLCSGSQRQPFACFQRKDPYLPGCFDFLQPERAGRNRYGRLKRSRRMWIYR